jgi:hypothetical protein
MTRIYMITYDFIIENQNHPCHLCSIVFDKANRTKLKLFTNGTKLRIELIIKVRSDYSIIIHPKILSQFSI